MPIKPLFKDEEAVAVWAWTSVPVLHSTRVRFDKVSSSDNVAIVFILIKIALCYRVSHQYVDNFGLNFAILKTTYFCFETLVKKPFIWHLQT